MAGLLRRARSLEQWLQVPAARIEVAMEILLIIRFCCDCTYGNQAPSVGSGMPSATWGLARTDFHSVSRI